MTQDRECWALLPATLWGALHMHGGSALASLAQHRAEAVLCSMSSSVLSSPVLLLARKQGLGSVEVRQWSSRSCRDCRGAAGAALPYAGYLRF